MAEVIKSFVVEYAPYAATAPTTTGWVKIENAVRSIPNLFPTPEVVDTSVVTNSRSSSIPGVAKAEAYTFKVAPDAAFLTAHTAMVTDQNAAAKGSFWMRVTYPKRGYTVTFPAKTVDELATPSGELGALDEVDWPVYPQADPVKAAIVAG
ncbi:hypothetical protein [Caproiciproducens sp.]|uniref:hypothetical protein n=1 Tax=Caproiciproducens sp. TaxID=1954376 RepID=UPI00289A8AE5|nr:hypothetical protein [Caproiciproducens sp.]